MLLFYSLSAIILAITLFSFLTTHEKPKVYSYSWIESEYENRLPKGFKEYMKSIFGGLIVGSALGIAISTFMIFAVLNIFSQLAFGSHAEFVKKDIVYSIDIIAFEDNHTYIISRRNVDEADRYYFMRTWDDGYKSGWVDQNDATIYFAESDHRVDVYQRQYEFNQNWLSRQIVDFTGKWFYIDETKEYKIYVPKEAIKENSFNIDLK